MATLMLSALPIMSWGQAKPGQPAPAFEVKDAAGKSHQLSGMAGKWVVLEWYNKDCPYVKKHYGSKNMQALQKTYTSKGVTWLTVISSAKGTQGYLEPAAALKNAKEQGSGASAVLLDTDGVMGKAYGAKTTPHMFVIDPTGKIVYAGAIDDNDSSDPSVIAKSKNHVSAALDEAMAGQKVTVASSRPYGCSVKYQ
ncbi:MAG: thioredoxin family protein [Bdellovibrionaceae bacterium]|nr:thioredoxin family protein [Pseudobdellovibrionaceae bacterium]